MNRVCLERISSRSFEEGGGGGEHSHQPPLNLETLVAVTGIKTRKGPERSS